MIESAIKILRRHWLVILIILFVFSTRLLVLNKDANEYWADERHYRQLITALEESKIKNDYMLTIQTIFRLNARPGLGLFYYPAAILEWKNPNIPFGSYFNLILNTLSIVIVYLIIRKIQGEKAALLATLIITFSIASVIYIRHLLPYDIALFLLLLGFYIYVNLKKTFIFGLLVALSFLTYPSYYYLLPIPIILFLYYRSLKIVLFFLMGVGTILMFTQLSYLLMRETTLYFRSLQVESGGATSVHQGDYMPAAFFIGEYILAVDGYLNLFLILAVFPAIFLIKDKKKFVFFGVYLILIFLIFEVSSHVLQRHVLYGRTIRPFYLMALVLTVLVLERVLSNFRSKKKYVICSGILVLFSFINWIPRSLTYKNLTYPPQFIKQSREYLKVRYGDQVKVEEALFVNYFGINSPPKMHIFKEYKDPEAGKFYIINANDIYPYYGSYNLNLFCNSEVLLKEPHVQYKFRPYLFEGFSQVMREQSAKDPLYYQLIYCK